MFFFSHPLRNPCPLTSPKSVLPQALFAQDSPGMVLPTQSQAYHDSDAGFRLSPANISLGMKHGTDISASVSLNFHALSREWPESQRANHNTMQFGNISWMNANNN